ncbi:MAG: acyltransferase [Parabacteroides distasonis]|nr:acyltransferase [Parabacteroides distasonis]
MQKETFSSAHFADTKPHYELLDGLRGVAALLVLIYHIHEGFAFAEATNGDGSGLITTLNHGHIAVDFFFILSGFVISYAYDDRWKKMSLGNFFKRRLIRLHPMLIMGAIIGTISFLIGGCQQWNGTITPIGWVITALLLTMCMIPAIPGVAYEVRGNGEMFPLNGPGWSLFFEYIGNILYALFIRRLSTKALAAVTVGLGVIHTWFFVWNISGYDSVGVGWTIDEINFWGGLVRMLFPFSIGMLLARTFKPRQIKGAFWICSALLLASFAVPYISPIGNLSINSLYEVICIALIFPFIVWLGACGYSSDRYTSNINKFLGDLSYPLYIVHYPIMYLFYAWLIEKRAYTWGETWEIASVVILSSIALAYICLKFYDEPIRKWLAHKFIKTS